MKTFLLLVRVWLAAVATRLPSVRAPAAASSDDSVPIATAMPLAIVRKMKRYVASAWIGTWTVAPLSTSRWVPGGMLTGALDDHVEAGYDVKQLATRAGEGICVARRGGDQRPAHETAAGKFGCPVAVSLIGPHEVAVAAVG